MKRPVRRIYSTEERKWMMEKLRDKEIQLSSPQISATGDGQIVWTRDPTDANQDVSRTKAQIQHLKKALDEGSVHDMSRSEKAERDREIRRLESIVKKRLVSKKFMEQPESDSVDYRKAVNGLVEEGSDPQHQKNVEMLKNLRRERDPDNPYAGDINDLRED